MAYPGGACRRVRMETMLVPDHLKRCKSRLRFIRRVAQALREEGLEALREAKSAHDALEALYHPHVDFDGVSKAAAREWERIEARI